MRLWKRIAALILAVVLTAYGLPMISSAQETITAEGGAANAANAADAVDAIEAADLTDGGEGALPDGAMRFVYKGFDAGTGILTMSLQVKMESDADTWPVTEGVFVFQTDVSSVVPVTRPKDGGTRTQLLDPTGGIVVAAGTGNPLVNAEEEETETSALHPTLRAYEEMGTNVTILEDSFSDLMSPAVDFETNHTAYMVSWGQVGEGSHVSKTANCYFQFRYTTIGNKPQPETEGDNAGYATIMDFDFQCYSGRDESGHSKPASDPDLAFLFQGSIRVPGTPEEAQTICDSFSYTDEEGTVVPMAMGGAAFIRTYGSLQQAYTYFGSGNYILTNWRRKVYSSSGWQDMASTRTTWWVAGATVNEQTDAPGLWYPHMDDAYIVSGYTAGITNTFSGDGTADFVQPSGEAESLDPRYVIPTESQWKDKAVGLGYLRDWIPDAYLGKQNTPVPLAYYLGTEVTTASLSSPEHDGLDAFLANTRWDFWLDDTVLLTKDMTKDEEGQGRDITVLGQSFTVKTAALDPSKSGVDAKYEGTKVWNVYDAYTGEYVRTGPVGVLMVMDPDTVVSFTDSFATDGSPSKTGTGAAPQFYVTNEAADADNYIWHNTSGHSASGQFSYQATFDPAGGGFRGGSIRVKLYKDASTPTRIDLCTDGFGTVPDGSGAEVKGFYVGTQDLNDPSVETRNDAVSQNGVTVSSTLYDQYGIAFADKWNTVEFAPKSGGDNPFQVEQVNRTDSQTGTTEPTNAYTIKYKSGLCVNDVTGGLFVLWASYAEAGIETEPLDVYVGKPADKLTFMSARIRTDSGSSVDAATPTEAPDKMGTIVSANLRVPSSDSATVSSVTARMQITEIYNQWWSIHVDESELEKYDLVSARSATDSTLMDLNALRGQGVQVEFSMDEDAVLPTDVRLGGDFVTNGTFSFTSRTPDTTNTTAYDPVVFRVTATYEGVSRYVEFQLRFFRDAKRLERIAVQPQPAEGETIVATIPAKVSEEKDQEIQVIPYDQYGTQWDWTSVQTAYAQHNYGSWTLVWNGTLPDGVTLTGDHKNILHVAAGIQNCTVKVWAKYGEKTSDPINLVISREESKPTTLSACYYSEGAGKSNNEIVSPDRNYGSSTKVVKPTVQVYDQYGSLMDGGSYDSVWTCTGSDEATSCVRVSRTTGNLSVDQYAPNCSVTVTFIGRQINTQGLPIEQLASVRQEFTVTVSRANEYDVGGMWIEPVEIEYPSRTSSAASRTQSFSAYGFTRYSKGTEKEDAQVISGSDLEWTLSEVLLRDGTKYLFDSEALAEDPTAIKISSSSDGTTTTYEVSRALTFTSAGKLSFNSVTTSALVPEYIVVSARHIGGADVEQKVDIILSQGESEPYEIYFPTETIVKVPTVDEKTSTLDLTARVRDQYGWFMDDRTVTWDDPADLPEGVNWDGANRRVTVTPEASAGSFAMTARCGSVSGVCYVSLEKDTALTATTMEMQGIVGVTGWSLELPAKVGAGYAAYDLEAVVKDQFGSKINSALTWTIEDATDNIQAEITDASTGILRLAFTEDARDSLENGDGTVTVKAATKNGVSATQPITVTLAEQQASYAVPVLRSASPTVPNKNDTEKGTATIEALVKDQYGRDMRENAAAYLRLAVPGKGLTLEQTSVAGVSGTKNYATLSVGSDVVGLLVSVYALLDPDGADSTLRDESKLSIHLDKGSTYPFELALLQADGVDETTGGSLYTAAIPYWVSAPAAAVAANPTSREVTVRAEIWDQYGAWMRVASASLYPVWEFVGEHSGVEFSQEMTTYAGSGSDRTVRGEDLILNVSNLAIPQGETTWDVTIRVRAAGSNIETDPSYQDDFVKTLTLRLTRDALTAGSADPYYLYIDDIQSDGTNKTALERPYAEFDENGRPSDGRSVYRFSPVVYDQYGMEAAEAQAVMDLDVAELEGRSFAVEKIFERGKSEEKGDSPISYQVYRVEYTGEIDENGDPVEGERTLIAEFDRQTGEFAVYTSCYMLSYVYLTAEYEPLAEVHGSSLASTKRMKLCVTQDAQTTPAAVEIMGNQGVYYIDDSQKSTEEEPAEDVVSAIYPVVYDQYGQAVDYRQVSIQWELYLAEQDENGSYLAYDYEEDEDGTERPGTLYLVQLGSKSGSNSTLIVKPDSFYETKEVMLRCYVIDKSNTSNNFFRYSAVKVTTKPAVKTAGLLTVIFDAGKYGRIVGTAVQGVSSGETPIPPGVKTIAGYGFMGWTSDGKNLVDVTEVHIYSDTIYTAVYRDVTATKFLEGYEDGTVRANVSVTRAEFVSMVARAMGGFDESKDYGQPFPDVAEGQWYTQTIGFAKEVGFVGGYPDGTFRPNEPITRAEAARMLADAAQLGGSERSGTFSDVKAGAWYAGYVEALVEAGAVDGYSDGTYRPDKKITRAEAVKMIVMMTVNAPSEFELNNIREYAYCPFKDVRKTHWAYPYILRAAGIA